MTEPVKERYRLVVAYDGAEFHGWQKQEPPGKEPLRTAGGELEKAVQIALQQRVDVTGASRTDSGVHARGQTAHFDAATRIPIERIAAANNSRLPQDLEVISAQIAPPNFNAIRHASNKQYRYRIFTQTRRPLEKRNYVYHCWYNLDIDRMNDAAARLVGEHDVQGFAAVCQDRTTTVRTIFKCHVERDEREGELHIVVQGSGFLYNMVRIISGTLIEVGRGAMPASQVDQALAQRERRLAGPTLPPMGLWLEWIKYPPDEVIRNLPTDSRDVYVDDESPNAALPGTLPGEQESA